MSKRGWILFLSLGLLWGMPYLLIRIAVGEIDPLVVAGTRTLMGALLLLPVALHRKALAPAFRKWKWLLAFTLIEMSVPWLLLGHAEKHINSSTAGLLIAVVPLFAALIMAKLGHERLELRRLVGLCVGFAGVALLIGLDIDFSDYLAVGATVIVSLCYAIGPIIIDRKLNDVPAIGVITASLILATIIYAPFAPFLWPSQVSANGRLVGGGTRRVVHRCRVPGVLRADRGSRASARHRDHLREPGRGDRARRAGSQRAADARHGRSAFRS